MTIRFHPFLLSVTILVILHACSTGSSRPADVSLTGPDLPPQTETADNELEKLQLDMQRDPSDRSLTEIIELSDSMPDYQPDVALEIVRSLESVSSSQLTAMIESQIYDPEFTEWLELSLQLRTVLINGSPVSAAARQWADYHYGHAVTELNFPILVANYSVLFSAPSQVAILLPTHGGLSAAAKAIRDGILSAYLEQPGGSVIRFYSSGENSESAIAAYLQASEDGATQIVGPLRIESTRSLAGFEDLDIPTLLLNEAATDKSDRPDQMTVANSLSLSQTEEAAAIANIALAQEQKQAIIIVPDSAWGTRIETAFAGIFEQGGGHISAIARFNSAVSDHSDILTQLLKIDESRQRKTDLQTRLGIPLNFEPSRRDDFDFIFMAANPAQGRELKPLLRFHDAGDIPVYAMGRVFSGKAEQTFNQDLNGIVFPTTRWQLQNFGKTSQVPGSVRGGTFGNLYALGQDAWHLLPWLPLMRKDPDLWFPGDVGALRLQANGHLYRHPAWAQFSAGQPIPYQWPDIH
jgi:outer membrane PBP1 activator LpoA protein